MLQRIIDLTSSVILKLIVFMKKLIKKDGQLLVIFKQIKYFIIKILVITIAYCKFK